MEGGGGSTRSSQVPRALEAREGAPVREDVPRPRPRGLEEHPELPKPPVLSREPQAAHRSPPRLQSLATHSPPPTTPRNLQTGEGGFQEPLTPSGQVREVPGPGFSSLTSLHSLWGTAPMSDGELSLWFSPVRDPPGSERPRSTLGKAGHTRDMSACVVTQRHGGRATQLFDVS